MDEVTESESEAPLPFPMDEGDSSHPPSESSDDE